jgi:flagellar hook-associated protein 1 FlgK
MTISSAINNALSGLRAAGRASELVSNNIANSMTEGYARRTLSISANATAGIGGVAVNGITRHVDTALLSDTRLAAAENGFATDTAAFFARFEGIVGNPEDAFSLTGRLAAFESSLVSAASRPDSPERLTQSVTAARDIAATLNTASNDVQALRQDADTSIASQVERLNSALQQVQTLNSRITSATAQGSDTASLQDQRQQIVDGISEMVSIRQVPRDNGQVAIYTTGGAVLIDGKAAQIEFEPTRTIVPHMTQANGLLSGISINGTPVRTEGEFAALRGGTLAAQFDIRDNYAVQAQDQLDAVARDLVERFQDPAVDPTLGVGDAGLFTDAGGAFSAVNEPGLAERISLNAAVDSRQGGEAWKLRDGVGATAQGDVGNATLLQNLQSALTIARPQGSTIFAGQTLSAFDVASGVLSGAGLARQTAEQTLIYTTTSLSEMKALQFADGVDTDTEIQNLMAIEQAYAANARVLETVDEMMNALMRI